MSSLTGTQLSVFRERLTALITELHEQLENEKAAADTVLLDQTKVGRLSRMDAMQQQNMAKSTMRSIEARLKLIHAALGKIEEGDFGYCDECGEEIALARLDIQPEARFCIGCQGRQEA